MIELSLIDEVLKVFREKNWPIEEDKSYENVIAMMSLLEKMNNS